MVGCARALAECVIIGLYGTPAVGDMSKSPSLRRIQADVRELALDPSDRYHAAPLENDMFEW